jgi:Oxidoreductase molybdopterin binding domain
MSLRTRTPSIFRPKQPIDQNVLTQNRAPVADLDRRGVLRGAISLGALTLLSGCDVTEEEPVQKVLRAVSSWNDGVQAALFRPDHLAPTFSPARVVKPPRFNAHFGVEDVKPVDGATWKLELAGLIEDKRPWTLQQLYALPEQEIIIRHVCVEGWDYIGQWSGPNLRGFLQRRRRRSDREVHLFPLRRRVYREHRYGDGAASADHSGDALWPTRPSPIRLATLCGCAPRPSSATRTPNGSRRSR